MKTKFGLLSIRSVLIVLVVASGYAHAGVPAKKQPPASLQLAVIYPPNGTLTPGQSQVVQVAAAIQPSPGKKVSAYRLMLKVQGQNGRTLLSDSFNPTQPDSLATINMKKLLPGDYALTAELQHNGTVVTASQQYQITKSGNSAEPTPTATATMSRTSTPTATSKVTQTATARPTIKATPSPSPTPSAFCSLMPPQTQLVDNLGNVYTMAGGAIYVNGVSDGYSANVTEVVWDGKDIWQYNGSQWYYQSAPCPGCAPGQGAAWIASTTGPTCSGPAPAATATPSPSPTPSAFCSLMPPQAQLVDNRGNVYTMAGGAIYVNGVSDGYSANVTEVAWDGTDVWQYNGSQWYYQSAPCPGCSSGQAGAWIASTTGPTCSGPTPTQTATATATATAGATPTINCPSGFVGATRGACSTGGAGNAIYLPGGIPQFPTIPLMNDTVHQGGAAYYQTPVDIRAFTTTFTFQDSCATQPTNCGNGFGFSIIADNSSNNFYPPGFNYSGNADVNFGWSQGCNAAGNNCLLQDQAIVTFNLYGGGKLGSGPPGQELTGYYNNSVIFGARSATVPEGNDQNMAPSGINLQSNDLFTVTLTYDGSNLFESIRDTVTGATFTHTYTGINLPAVMQQNTAFVGFAAGSGAAVLGVNINGWTYTVNSPGPTAATAPLTATASPSATNTATATATQTATVISTSTPTAASTSTATAPPSQTATGATPTATPSAMLTAQVASTPALTRVYRIGVNLSGNDYSSASDYMQNMFDNPGFEPSTDAHLIVVASGATSTTFTDSADPGTKSSGYWVGATASVRTGAAVGDQFTITSYTAGGAYTYGSCENSTGGSISCPTLASGVAVTAVISGTDLYGGIGGGNAIGGWSADDTESELSTAEAYDGQGSLAINVSDGSSHSVHFSWDQYVVNGGSVCSNDDVTPCTMANENTDCGGSNTCLFAPYSGPWHPVVGSFEVAFYALASSTSTGTPQVSFTLSRSGGVSASHTWTLTNDGAWHQYTYSFSGNDTSTGAQNPMTFTLTGTNGGAETGATIYVDDAYLGKTAASTTGFRNEMITTLSTMNVGSLRIMDGGTIDANDAQLEGLSGCTWGGGSAIDQSGTCDFEHGPAFADGTGTGQWTYSSTDLYPLSSQLGAVPWITISNGFSDADLKTFIDNACTAFSTYNFPSIWIEQSNENWNGGGTNLKYGAGNYGALGYGGNAGRNLSVMATEATAQCPTYASRFHYVVNNQECNDGVIAAAYAGASSAGYPIPNTNQYGAGGAPYYSASGEEIPIESGSLEAQAAAYALAFFSYIAPIVGPPGTGCMNNGIYSDYGQIGSNNTESFYEVGPNGWNAGGGNAEQMYLSEGGYPSAGWMAENYLLAQQQLRTPIQNEFTLVQSEFGNGGVAAPIWGIVHDLDSDFGPTFPHLRPIGQGMEVVNSAIGGAYYPVKAPSGTVINAYQNAGAWSAALVNTTAAPITVTVEFPSSGTLPQTAETVLNTNGLSDNAENSNDVFVGALPGGLSTSGQNVTLTLPPFSVVAIH